MSRIFNNVTELVGKTPLIAISRFAAANGASGARVLAKLERQNPAGSAKDRVALSMLRDAAADGRLAPGGLVIEPTSGNTGIGIAAMAACLGYEAVIVMPDSMSPERITLIRAYGARIVLTPGAGGMAAAIQKAEELHRENPGSIIAGQFDNPANPRAHYLSTGPEIWDDTDGEVDIFVAGVGTGGTITGVGRCLKEKNPDLTVVAVEPAASPLLSGGKAGPHALQGIGANFIPAVLDRSVYDEIVTVSNADALDAMRALATTEGLLCGVTSGAAAFAACELAKRPENRGKLIVCLLPDTGERYLSVLA
ncbi:MAG: cysteine synthase A [Oscillospiraceae bacterium]